jgi:hypothetical protein
LMGMYLATLKKKLVHTSYNSVVPSEAECMFFRWFKAGHSCSQSTFHHSNPAFSIPYIHGKKPQNANLFWKFKWTEEKPPAINILLVKNWE